MQSSSKKPVLRVALALPLRQHFDYLPGDAPVVARPGMRVLVPFGRRKMVGVVVEIADKSELPLDKLAEVKAYPDGEQLVLTGETLELLKWCWRYYKHAPGEVVFNALPPLLRKVEGVIPPLPVQYHLTAAGGKRLQEPAGRIRAQYRLLEEMREGAATGSQLRKLASTWRKTLARLLEQGWVRSEIQQPAQLNPATGPVLLDTQCGKIVDPFATPMEGMTKTAILRMSARRNVGDERLMVARISHNGPTIATLSTEVDHRFAT